MMDRRAFIGTAVVSALMLSSRARGQRAEKLPRVALVLNTIPVADLAVHRLPRAFTNGLRDLGLVEGRNIIIERRSAEGRYERFPVMMQELLALPVDVIVASGRSAVAATRATDTIPIVAVGIDVIVDPGAATLAPPGRNLTGLTMDVGVELNGKRLQLLKEVAPKASRVAFLGYSSRPSHRFWRPATEAAARTLGLTLVWVDADTNEQFDAACPEFGSSPSPPRLSSTRPEPQLGRANLPSWGCR